MWNSTDVLYAMFILKANCLFWSDIIERHWMTDEMLIHHVCATYADLFADRGIAEEEFEAYVSDQSRSFIENNSSWFSAFVTRQAIKYGDSFKIKFRFVED